MASKFYVIFHGAWAFVDNVDNGEKFIYAYAPCIPNHVYMGGSWLGETQILKGTYLVLSGGAQGSDTVRNHYARMVTFPKKAGLPPAGVDYHLSVQLPRPVAIHPEMISAQVKVTFDANDEGQAPVALVVVFEYALSGLPELMDQQGKSFWKPPASPVDPVTLHFFAAEDRESDTDPAGDFSKVSALLGYPAASFVKPWTPVDHLQPISTPCMEGREFEIRTFLYERVDHLRSVGEQMQRMTDQGSYTWSPPLPIPTRRRKRILNLDLASCGGGGGGS